MCVFIGYVWCQSSIRLGLQTTRLTNECTVLDIFVFHDYMKPARDPKHYFCLWEDSGMGLWGLWKRENWHHSTTERKSLIFMLICLFVFEGTIHQVHGMATFGVPRLSNRVGAPTKGPCDQFTGDLEACEDLKDWRGHVSLYFWNLGSQHFQMPGGRMFADRIVFAPWGHILTPWNVILEPVGAISESLESTRAPQKTPLYPDSDFC